MFESQSPSRVGQKSSTQQKTTIFSTLAKEKSLSDYKKPEPQWKPSANSSVTPACLTSPLVEKPTGKESMPQTPPFSAMFDSSGYNRNLYPSSSAEDSCGGLYYHDNNLLSGSLEALIQHLVPNVDYYPDRTYIFTFLLSSRLFMHPSELMAKVCHLCVEHQRSSDPSNDKNQIRKIAPKILQLLTEWTETFPYDFRDERVMRNLKDLAHRITSGEEERLNYIGPEEFVQAFVQKDPLDNDKTCYSDRKKTRNLEAYVEWFNRLSYLVATEICMPVKKKHRARMIEYFIDVARECFNIGNFNSLMAIISGMNMSPVSRLKKTWAKVKTAKFDILEHQMDPSSNFYNYRTALRGAAQRSLTAHSSREKIVIPFFSLLIKDIYFLNEGCANRLPNGHVNFEKFWELAKQVSELMTWKQVECPFERDRKILQHLLTVPVFSEDALYLASYESEGPETHVEKDRWKSLRSSLLGRV
ncbi:ras-GEF domain-containing family member 1B isoform X2 [Echinops telfairi]|uniref:Ras-GEF domain-containing family member 1B isoform X2 n=1 Tax=Echinops telfairi TaxID=9371 RepID=A0AC55CIN4_ECHTE|nr:ras-GEF domain-containing family member 1B isoform X2 [Echinops telfairi]